MEKYWREQQEIQEEEEEASQRTRVNPEDYEPKFFGFSTKSMPGIVKVFYFAAVFGLIAGVIYIGNNATTYIPLYLFRSGRPGDCHASVTASLLPHNLSPGNSVGVCGTPLMI